MSEKRKFNKKSSHTRIEDTIAIIIGTLITGFGLLLMQTANTLIGGTAGLALLLHYISNIEFGILFFLLNIPFYYLAYRQMGLEMFIKTIIAVSLLSLMTMIHPKFVMLDQLQPFYGTILANVFIGIGMLILFRHKATLGGFNVLSLFIQKRYNISAGKVQMALDATVLLASFMFFNWQILAMSIVGVIVLNSIIVLNHKAGRYTGY